MSLMVTFKNEVIRICPNNAKKIEVSKNIGIKINLAKGGYCKNKFVYLLSQL